MVNLVVLLRDPDSTPLDPAANHSALSSAGNDRSDALLAAFGHDGNDKSIPSTFATAARRIGWTRFTRGAGRSRTRPRLDPYTLVLLADQEFLDGRGEQAMTLLDAAYAAFD